MIVFLSLIAVHADSDSDPTAILLAAGPLAGVAFFVWVFRRYRNIDKRHVYEHSPNVKSAVTKAQDNFIRRVDGSRDSKIKNGNYGMPTWRIGEQMPVELKAPAFLKMFSKK